MRMFITSKNKYLSNDMKIFGTCSIPLMSTGIWYMWDTSVRVLDICGLRQDLGG